MLKRLLCALAVLAAPSAAQADLRATYSDGSVIEINDDGSFRGNVISDGRWMIHVRGIDYLIVNDGGEQKVLDASNVAQLVTQMTPPIFAHMVNEVPPLSARRAGTVMVAGQQATGYSIDDETEISFAVSSDPELAELGRVIAYQFNIWTTMQGPLGRLSAPLADVFETGAAVRFGKIDIVSVVEIDIDDSHFTLPGEPLGWEETREVLVRTGIIKVG